MGTPSVPAAQVSPTPTHNQPTSSSSTAGASKPPQNKPAFSGSTVGGKKSVHQPIGSLVPGTLNVSTSSNANAVASSSWFAPGSQPLASSSSTAGASKPPQNKPAFSGSTVGGKKVCTSRLDRWCRGHSTLPLQATPCHPPAGLHPGVSHSRHPAAMLRVGSLPARRQPEDSSDRGTIRHPNRKNGNEPCRHKVREYGTWRSNHGTIVHRPAQTFTL